MNSTGSILKKYVIITLLSFLYLSTRASNIEVADPQQLQSALRDVLPGDTIFLLSGVWKDVGMEVRKGGTNNKPVVICAKNPGSVKFTGNSFIKFGADYVTVAGIHFTDGYAVKGPIVEFRVNDKLIANHCRLTNSVIEKFSKPNRMESDSWIVFWGKYNRIDHCLIGEKYNLGTTLIVNLNDERSQNNQHSIDSNYFRGRPRMGGNGGETIRVGVSRYSLTSSETRIHHNYFERCNGEVEIISLKSGKNIVSDNLFFESEGGLVLRHGNENVIKNNIFLGNGKPYTGGIRVVNPGHVIVNNLLIGLAGERFHSGFSVLNGVPNSAINRYAQVKDVLIKNNSFIECNSILFGAGKDPERTAAPENVHFVQNLIVSRSEKLFEDLNQDGGIVFSENGYIASSVKSGISGFNPIRSLSVKKVPFGDTVYSIPVSRLGVDLEKLSWMSALNTCPDWYRAEKSKERGPQVFKVASADAQRLNEIFENAVDGDRIELTEGSIYGITKPLIVKARIQFTASDGLSRKPELVNLSNTSIRGLIVLENGADLTVQNIRFISAYKNFGSAESGITTTSGPMNLPYRLSVNGCVFTGFNETGYACIRGTKSTFASKVEIENSFFINNSCSGIEFSAERDDKGYYNVEELYVRNCLFSKMLNSAINVYRGGNDESTTGPLVVIDHCTFNEVDNRMQSCVVKLIGVQQASVLNSIFYKSGSGGRSIWFEEMVWDKLKVDYCNFYESGRVTAFFNNLNTTKQFSERPTFRDVRKMDYRLMENEQILRTSQGRPIGISIVPDGLF